MRQWLSFAAATLSFWKGGPLSVSALGLPCKRSSWPMAGG
jgi:hypothetical protein